MADLRRLLAVPTSRRRAGKNQDLWKRAVLKPWVPRHAGSGPGFGRRSRPDGAPYGFERRREELGFHWYEDPLADDDLSDYVKLKQQLHIPILATEYAPGGFTAFAPWLTAQATD